MVSSRLRNTIVFFAICGLLATSAFAGTFASNPTNFAHEQMTNATAVTFGAQVYQMGIARNPGQSFIIKYTLSAGKFAANPVLTYGGAATDAVVVLRSGGLNFDTVEFDVNVLGSGNGTAINDSFTLNGSYLFPANSAVDASATITIRLFDTYGDLDTAGTKTRTLASLKGAASLVAAADLATINATIDPPLTKFVNAGTDTDYVAKALVTATNTVVGVRNAANNADYTLGVGDLVTFTINGDFSGLAKVGYDIDDNGTIAANELFTVAGSVGSLTVTADRLPNAARNMLFEKTSTPVASTLSPRTFSLTVSIVPVLSAQSRTVATATDWFVWRQNGTTLLAPYISFSPGNEVKFRFTNSSDNDITINVAITLDQGTFTAKQTQIIVPKRGSKQVTLSQAFAAGTTEEGPLCELTGGQQPVRGKATFTALTASPNVSGIVLIWSPVGVITTYVMPQQ